MRTVSRTHNSSRPVRAESRSRFIPGSVLDLWHWLGAVRDPNCRIPYRTMRRRYREVSLDDWAVLCDLCGKPTLPSDNPHGQCMALEACVADVRPAFGVAP